MKQHTEPADRMVGHGYGAVLVMFLCRDYNADIGGAFVVKVAQVAILKRGDMETKKRVVIHTSPMVNSR